MKDLIPKQRFKKKGRIIDEKYIECRKNREILWQ